MRLRRVFLLYGEAKREFRSVLSEQTADLESKVFCSPVWKTAAPLRGKEQTHGFEDRAACSEIGHLAGFWV